MTLPKWPIFTGPLAPVLTALVAEQRALGYHPKEAQDFARFDRYCQAVGHPTCTLPQAVVEAWTAKQPHETETSRQRRVTFLRVLARYMQRLGYPAWVPPPQMTPRTPPPYVPYIFTRAEVQALFTQVDALAPDPRSPARHRVLPVLFRLLYSSGLRVSEALALRWADLDPATGTIQIRHAKGHKARQIPLHPALQERLRILQGAGPAAPGPLALVFPGPRGTPYAAGAVYGVFRQALWAAGIPHRGRGYGPRLHDLRHTFAVHCLQQWVTTGVDLTVALPYLSVYLGHTGLRSTQTYLRLTAELYPEIQARVERQWGTIVPGSGERS